MVRRPLIEEYRRSWGVARTIKRLERDVEEVQRSPRSGDVTQQIFVAGGGGSSGGGGATPTDRIFDTAVLNGIIAGVNDVQFYNGGVLGGAFRSGGFQVYDGGDILMWSGAYPGSNQTGYWNGATGEIAFFDDAFANRVGIRGPAAAQADNWVIRLPADDPAIGEILAVQGIAGSLVQTEWAAAAAPGAHALVSASHTGEADYTSTLGLLGLGVGTGDLIVYSDAGVSEVARFDAATGHLTVGAALAVDANTVMKFNKIFTDPAGATTGIGGNVTLAMTGNNSQVQRGLTAQVNASGAFVASGILTAEHNTINVAAGGVTADDMRNLDLLAVVGAASTLVDRYGVRVRNASGSGAVTTQYAIYLENMTKGATDWAIYSLGGNSSHLGAFTLGANTAPHASAILDLASTTLGLLIPRIPTASLPAGVNGLIAYDSTTNKFVAYENGAYANMIGGGGGAVATDVIWDAKGDLAVGTGANTAIRLAVGADDTIVMADAATATGLKYVASATPSTQAFGDTAAVGTGDTFTRGDHKHAMPADPVTAHAAAGDPHTGYVREADANWIDLTDTGATTLHSHAGGGGTHNLLDGATHTDTLADTVTDGDVIIGNVTPKWSSLPIAIPAANDLNVLAVGNGQLRPSWGQILGNVAPSAIGTAAAGTVVFASRRDHVHATGAGTPSTQAFGDAASVGTGPAAAMTDHKHAMPSATITKHILLVGGTPTTTAYAASAQRIEFGTNDRDDTVNDFGATAKEHIFWKHPLPGWDGGTVTATFYWYVNSAATTSVRWGLEAVSSGDGSAMDSAFGTPQEVTDALDGTAYHLRISGATPAITVAGAGNNELVTWRAYRDPTNGADDCTSIARLSAILVTYTGAVT